MLDKLSFLFPPPAQLPQAIFCKGPDGSVVASKIHLVNRPVPELDAEFAKLAADGYYMLGICAYQNWPGRIHNPRDIAAMRDYDLFERPYFDRFIGFMHNFREPRDVFPDGLPLLDMDFSDYVQVRKRGREKQFDLLYYGGHRDEALPNSVPWSRVVKRHDLAQRLIESLLTRDADVRIAVVQDVLDVDDPRVTKLNHLPYRAFLDLIEASRILFIPSVLDASPRILTEALCLDTYVMVNRAIVGGWKYVNDVTGAFFDEGDELAAYDALRARGPAATRAWFLGAYPNHALEARFDAWVHECCYRHSALNRLGGVFYLEGAQGRARRAYRELLGRMAVYPDLIEQVPAPSLPERPEQARALGHLAALRRARERGLRDVAVIEGDVEFLAPRRTANRRLEALDRAFPDRDALVLGHLQVTAREATSDPDALRVRAGRWPHGYLLRAERFDELIDGLAAACAAMADGAGDDAARLDAVWSRLCEGAVVLAPRVPVAEGTPRIFGALRPMGHDGASCHDGAGS